MKFKTIFFISLVATHLANGQITITDQDLYIPLSPDTAKAREAIGTGFTVPSVGANQTWDYSTLIPSARVDFVLDPPDNDPNFAQATGMFERTDQFGPQIVSGFYDYYRHDATGYYFMGTRVDSSFYNISGQTGTQGDELLVLKGHTNLGNSIVRYKLPMAMGTAWTNNYSSITDFAVTVSFVGLANDSAQLRRYFTESYEVVGWGQASLPSGLGTHDALLLKIAVTQIDSIFINNAPANPLLLIGLGLTQGMQTKINSYEFMVKGLNRSAITLVMDATFSNVNWAEFCTMPPQNIGIEEEFLQDVSLFPNPTTDRISVQFSKPLTGDVVLRLHSLTGRLIHEETIREVGYVKRSISIKQPAGVYMLSIQTSEGKNLHTEQIIVQ